MKRRGFLNLIAGGFGLGAVAKLAPAKKRPVRDVLREEALRKYPAWSNSTGDVCIADAENFKRMYAQLQFRRNTLLVEALEDFAYGPDSRYGIQARLQPKVSGRWQEGGTR